MDKELFLLKYPEGVTYFNKLGDLDYRRVTKEIQKDWFTIRANLRYDNKFDYSKFEYIGSGTKSIIICPKHGKFMQSPNHHLKTAKACPKCTNKKVFDTRTFISSATKVHGSAYNYAPSVYTLTDTPIEIFCTKCATTFFQKPHYHLSGSGCPTCAGRSYAFLYVISAGETRTKIGVSNNPCKRIKTVSNSLGVDFKLKLLYVFESNALPVEQALHSKYNYCRSPEVVKGDGYTEVFDFSKEQNILSDITKFLNSMGGVSVWQ